MERDGYNALLQMMGESGRQHYRPQVVTGKVTSISPLAVMANGILLIWPDLLVGEHLLHLATKPLTVGDEVAMITADFDKYIVVCKVVKS